MKNHQPLAEMMAFRFPTMFYLWYVIFPTVHALFWGYLAGASLCMVCAFRLARRFCSAPIALLPALLLSAYFLYGAVTPFFTYMEYWALFFSLPGFLLIAEGYGWWGVGLYLMAALMREWFCVSMLAPAAAILRARGPRGALPFFCAFAFYALAAVLHYHQVNIQLEGQATMGGARFHQGGLDFLLSTLSFSLNLLPAAPWNGYLIGALGLLGVALLPDWNWRLALGGMILLPAAIFTRIGYSWAWYYGAVYLPWLMILATLPLARLVGGSPVPGRFGERRAGSGSP
jgi:hypothetical protein